ncbi:hypothetical protein CEXT_714771 [Caerostris extrusa]|uniref:Uncharacterized protein n=1 Tax=Caerostris extrusa TaxID=172846 RepID=A0AAV4R2M3_CAEEX|nr:hypothetical protein CEXT_714771 [Caerostris extrusa]
MGSSCEYGFATELRTIFLNVQSAKSCVSSGEWSSMGGDSTPSGHSISVFFAFILTSVDPGTTKSRHSSARIFAECLLQHSAFNSSQRRAHKSVRNSFCGKQN